MNIIISVYTPNIVFGFGDYIRGIMFLKQTQPSMKVIADYNSHSISKYLFNNENNTDCINYSKIKIVDLTSFKQEDAIKVINELQKPCAVYINVPIIGTTISEEIRNQMLSTFSMKESFKNLFLKTLNDYNLINQKFVVLHIRLDDNYFNPNLDLPTFSFLDEYIVNHIVPEWSKNVLVLSNSYKFRQTICKKYNFKQYDFIPVHLGKIQLSEQNIENTLIEFFTISKAAKIYQFNELHWQTSGFSKRVSEMYGIEFIRIGD